MKVKERESWVLTNEGKGGSKPSFDEFNKSFKGQERNPKAKEFASQGLDEYHHYSERAEYKENKDDSKNKEQKQQKKHSSKSNMIKNVVGRVAAVAASAVVIVSTYASITGVDSTKWHWSEDNQTVSVELVRRDGDVIKELTADVSVEIIEPVCNAEGLKTYTATALDEDDVVYTDVHTETLSPLNHDRIIIEEKIENGQIIRVYECSRCHERFTITIGINENE